MISVSVYTDNYYTSLKLAKYLLSCQTNLVGTIRKTSGRCPRINTIHIGYCENIKLAMIIFLSIDGLTKGIYSLSAVTAGNDVDVPVSRFNTTIRKINPAMLLDYRKYISNELL